MGNVVVSEFITLDGVFEDPGGAGDLDRGGWSFQFDFGPEGNQFKLGEVQAAGALLLGRVTYEGFAKAWPAMKDDAGFADKMNSMPKYVVSSSMDAGDWNNTTVLRGDLVDAVRALKRDVAGDVLVNGSGQLVRVLMQHDLVDEYRLMVYPVVLGAGMKLFGAGDAPNRLRLTETRAAGDSVILIYTPLRS
jgi:dihydrofolate reductase